MRNMLTAAIMLMTVVSAKAADTVQVINPFGPGGSSALVTQYVGDALAAKGYKVEVKNVGNCAVAKNIWATSPDLVVMLQSTDTSLSKMPECLVNTQSDNFVFTNHNSQVYLCNAGPDGKTLADFNKPGAVNIIGDSGTMPSAALMAQLSAKNKNTNKVLQYPFITNLSAAAKSKEIDFILANGTYPELQLGAKCFWATGDKKIEGYEQAKALHPELEILNVTYNYWFIAKNFFPSDMPKIKADITESWRTRPEWVELRKKRGWIDSTIPSGDEANIKMINQNRAIWDKHGN